MPKEQNFKKTSFLKQAQVISNLIRTNPIMNDSDKESMQETVGVLNWLNQAQLSLAKGAEIPKDIAGHIFEGRSAQPTVPVTQPLPVHREVVPKSA